MSQHREQGWRVQRRAGRAPALLGPTAVLLPPSVMSGARHVLDVAVVLALSAAAVHLVGVDAGGALVGVAERSRPLGAAR